MNYKTSIISYDSKDFNLIEISDDQLGLVNLNELKEAIEKVISEGNIHIGIDLRNVNLINSSGLGILISCLTKVKSQNGSMVIFNLNDKLMKIFQITKLNVVFDIKSLD